MPNVEEHIHYVIAAVIVISFVPAIVEIVRERRRARREALEAEKISG